MQPQQPYHAEWPGPALNQPTLDSTPQEVQLLATIPNSSKPCQLSLSKTTQLCRPHPVNYVKLCQHPRTACDRKSQGALHPWLTSSNEGRAAQHTAQPKGSAHACLPAHRVTHLACVHSVCAMLNCLYKTPPSPTAGCQLLLCVCAAKMYRRPRRTHIYPNLP